MQKKSHLFCNNSFTSVDQGPRFRRQRIGLHVDNCLGGYLLSFMSRSGAFRRAWDFRVPGVTSMSVDVHKYGLASKGVSVCCFRSPKLRRGTYMPSVDGCEGLYVTPTLQGSRSGVSKNNNNNFLRFFRLAFSSFSLIPFFYSFFRSFAILPFACDLLRRRHAAWKLQGIIAQAWATLLGTGEDGYEKMAAQMVGLVERVKQAVG